jgi:hypothetical protein
MAGNGMLSEKPVHSQANLVITMPEQGFTGMDKQLTMQTWAKRKSH